MLKFYNEHREVYTLNGFCLKKQNDCLSVFHKLRVLKGLRPLGISGLLGWIVELVY